MVVVMSKTCCKLMPALSTLLCSLLLRRLVCWIPGALDGTMSDSGCKKLPCSHFCESIARLSFGRDPLQNPSNAFDLFSKNSKLQVGALVGGTAVDRISMVAVVQGFGISDKDESQTRVLHVQGLLETGIWMHMCQNRTTNPVGSTAWAAD